MAKRTIELDQCNFRSISIAVGKPVVTSIIITSAFNPEIAEQLGIKTNVYKKPEGDSEVVVRSVGLDCKLLGPSILISPAQLSLDGNTAFSLSVLSIELENVKKHKDDEQMLLTSKITLVDEDGKAHGILHRIKKESFDLRIGIANKKEAAAAEEQLKLIVPKRGRPADEGESEEGGALAAQVQEIAKTSKAKAN